MKVLVLVSILLHFAVLWFSPLSGKSPFYKRAIGPAVRYAGKLPDAMLPALEHHYAPEYAADYHPFLPPEAEASIIDPPAVSFRTPRRPPRPELPEEGTLWFNEAVRPGELNVLGDYLRNYTVHILTPEETVMP